MKFKKETKKQFCEQSKIIVSKVILTCPNYQLSFVPPPLVPPNLVPPPLVPLPFFLPPKLRKGTVLPLVRHLVPKWSPNPSLQNGRQLLMSVNKVVTPENNWAIQRPRCRREMPGCMKPDVVGE